MPLHVRIAINDAEIETLHIGRIEPLASTMSEHFYLVTDEEISEGHPNWAIGREFKHTYSDGALICVRKAIDALLESPDVV
jgi:hypothetical protein